MINISIFWHKNPDTDSVISAIIFANYLKQKWYNATAYKLWNLNNETKYLLELFWEEIPETISSLPEWTKIWLVDHNESTQSIDNIEELEVEFLIDHHKIDFKTNNPINIRMEKLCSTASVLYKMFIESNFKITERIAKLIISAILSDSLMFKSPTTTKEDIEIVKWLQKVAKIENIEKFAMKMFNIKSDLWNITAEEIVKYDYKNYEINWKKIEIWTVETTNSNYAFNRKNEILKAMNNIKNKEKLDFILFSIVDLIKENNTCFVLDWKDSSIIEKVFEIKVENNEANLWRRLSRKKQIVPYLTKYFEKK